MACAAVWLVSTVIVLNVPIALAAGLWPNVTVAVFGSAGAAWLVASI